MGSSLDAYAWPDGHSKQVAYMSTDSHIHELVVGPPGGGSWTHADLTQIAGGPPLVISFNYIIGYAWPDGHSKQVVYTSADGHIHELVVGPPGGGSWTHADLTQIAGGPPPVTGSITGYAWPDGHSKQVAYVSADGHIHELVVGLPGGGSWTHADLTQIAGAPPASAGSAIIGYAWPDGHSKQVVYTSADGHIHELVVGPPGGGSWTHADLTQIAGGPPASLGTIIGYAWPDGHSKQVAYASADGHIHELVVGLPGGGSWTHADLTQIAGAPPASAGSTIIGYAWPDGHSKQVAYASADGHIHELVVGPPGGGSWTHADLTQIAGGPPII